MQQFKSISIFFALVIIILASCKSKDDDFGQSVITYKQFIPMQVGATQFYRMDSTVPTAFGVQLVVHSYLAKDSIADQRLNAVGDTTFDVYRFLTDTLQTQPWTLGYTYQIVYTKNTADLIQENGLRYIKLTTPVANGYSWDGNQYFAVDGSSSSGDSLYFYYDWNYTYQNVGAAYQNGVNAYENTVIVNEISDTLSALLDPTSYQQSKFSQEVYAQGVGLIYQNSLFYIHQPENSSISSGYDERSFGIKLVRIQ